MTLRGPLATVFAVDTRGLALLRIGLAVFLLVDVVGRALALPLLTDDGPVTRAFLSAHSAVPILSLHMLVGGAAANLALLVVTALVAVLLAVGLRTRFVTALALVLAISLQERNPLVAFGGDVLLRSLLLWGLFLPLGARFSVDARRRGGGPAVVAGPATIALFVQQIALYAGGAVIKLGDAHWRDLSALELVLASDLVASDLGVLLRGASGFLAAATAFTLVVEALGPLVLVVPRPRVRGAAILAIAYFQLGIWLLMGHGQFQGLAIVSLLAFVPSSTLDRLFAGSGARDAVVVDGAPHGRARPLAWPLLAVLVTTNLLALPRGGALSGVEPLRLLALDQSWGMYRHPAGVPAGTFLVVGVEVDGGTIDLLTGARPASITPREHVFSAYADFRTRRLWEALLHVEHAPFLPEVARWQCVAGAERVGAPLQRVAAYFLDERKRSDRGEPYLATLFDAPCPPTPE